MARTSITIVLELDESVDLPVGSARLPDGPARPFHGWLGLTEAIDALAGIRARCEAASSGAGHLRAAEAAGAPGTERSPSS